MMWKETRRMPWWLHWFMIAYTACLAVAAWVFDTPTAGLGWAVAALSMVALYFSDLMDEAQNQLIKAQRDALKSLGFYDEGRS